MTGPVVLRIDRQDHRRVVPCCSYSVERRSDGRTLIYGYESDTPTGEPSAVIALEADEICYVLVPMARGRPLTAEVIRPQETRQAALRVTS